MNRRDVLKVVSAITTSPIAVLGATWRAHARPESAQQKKGRPARKADDGNLDGMDTIDGAVWQLVATNSHSGKVIDFFYRAKNLVLYDIRSGRVIGKVEQTRRGHGRVTFVKKSPFPGTFDIQLIRRSHWKGELTRGDDTWTVKIDCVDR
jgi:hypothetical protein